VAGAATLAATYALARSAFRPEHAWVAPVAAALVLASPPFAVWSSQGMETPLFAAAVTATLAAGMRRPMGWAMLAAIDAYRRRPRS
jgi:hypothetical protein